MDSKIWMPIEDYVKMYPILKEEDDEKRPCVVCKRSIYYKNGIYFMIGKRLSIFVCRFCIPNLKLQEIVKPQYLKEDIYIWEMHSNIPHSLKDKLRVCLKDSKIYVEVSFNPSKKDWKVKC